MEIEFIKDILLIVLCGASAFYCWMLSQRLKKLNDLKSGVGASIVTLTEAIERTHAAATTARGELFESIEEIKGLMADAESKAARLERIMTDCDVKVVEAEQATNTLKQIVEIEIPGARRKALKTTEGLLKVMADMKRHTAAMPRVVSSQTGPIDTATSAPTRRSHVA
ncbi:MAG: hypothetical protein ACSHX3_10910 [Litorimonas sp.]